MTEAAAGARLRQMGRGRAVLSLLVLAGGVFATISATWVTATATSAVTGAQSLAVSGSTASPVLSALTLGIGAGALAMSLSGRVATRIVAVLVALCALGAALAAVATIREPSAAAESAAAAITGVEAAADVSVTVWPILTTVLCLIVVLLSAVVAVMAFAQGPSRRFDAPAGQASPALAPSAVSAPGDDQGEDAGQLWDALSRGDDPTDNDAPGERPDATRDPGLG